MPAYRRPSAVRLFALAFALVAGLAIALGAMLSAAEAAPLGGLKQLKVPTANSDPHHITVGSDGNLWFTEGDVNPPSPATINVGKITPAGQITEFPCASTAAYPTISCRGRTTFSTSPRTTRAWGV